MLRNNGSADYVESYYWDQSAGYVGITRSLSGRVVLLPGRRPVGTILAINLHSELLVVFKRTKTTELDFELWQLMEEVLLALLCYHYTRTSEHASLVSSRDLKNLCVTRLLVNQSFTWDSKLISSLNSLVIPRSVHCTECFFPPSSTVIL